MTDSAPPEEPEKTTIELEAEARERTRSAMANLESEPKTLPGQPEVTKFRKASGRRTQIVSVLSLILLITLALGGDHLLHALKKGDEKKTDTEPLPPTGALKRERKNIGMDSNPFGLFRQDKPIPDSHQTPVATLQMSPTLDKAAALADGPGTAIGASQLNDAGSSKLEPQNHSRSQNNLAAGTPVTGSDTDTSEATSGLALVIGVRRLGLNPDLYIPVDRYIPCSMMWRFVSDVGGHISCLISEDVYSASNHVKLLPAGTVARGVYRTGALQHGRSRMFVVWTELRTPEPGSLQIPLTNTEASGPLGEAGIGGWIDNHFWERFGNALMLSTVQDMAAAAADSAPGKDRNTDYTENTRSAASEMAKTTLENSINIPPTMYLNQGDVIGIMTGTDIDFSSVYQLRLK
ncbi:TrbI/VirB10 family protein [Citrobacter freundii]|uniref:VirB10/TraB/TrbI family type IV secretion system protein n=1 Tax=Citrobacter freundii TaxID=546 RepID=UPI000C809A4A|nr:VirB10/TraB/TrbI family type IV secretion system protein [Citrobacter freundii]EMB4337269.1 TrbI/VirB10 family protein [Citrobacter freundii]MBJ9041915.1 TrbI/VirB10 family protein [Citrobacter freundii]NTY76585.1 TrbI/VirB10 family protein [Citrobacter freundii]NUA13033.1 TrbI/VirB10 family protein [Citrobacter freundii]PMD03460.1 hypothetical protein CJ200_02050 [Citrobacter freundii]